MKKLFIKIILLFSLSTNAILMHAMFATALRRLGFRQPVTTKQAGRATVARQAQQQQQLKRLTHTGLMPEEKETKENQAGQSWWSRFWHSSGTNAQGDEKKAEYGRERKTEQNNEQKKEKSYSQGQ